MRLSRERVGFLAKAVVDGLLKGKWIVSVEPASATATSGLIENVEKIILDDLMVEDRLNAEVEQILKAHEREMEKGSVDYRKMFQMVKHQLVKERGIIL